MATFNLSPQISSPFSAAPIQPFQPPNPPPTPIPPSPEPPPPSDKPLPTQIPSAVTIAPPQNLFAFPSSSKTLDPSQHPIPPTPDPPPPIDYPVPSTDPLTPSAIAISDPLQKQKWSTLFASKPKNAGSFAADDLELKFDGENLIPTEDIIQASREQWNDFLIGFFLDSPLSYYAVVNYLRNHWKPQGKVDYKSNGSIFFFQFSSLADRIRILEADPVIIHNKLFIVKPWEPSLSNVANSVTAVSVWIKMYNIPLVAWSKRGISWLATRVGKFLCMDTNTESLNRLEYAKCMVEVSSNSPLLDSFPIRNLDGSVQRIKIYYLWKPEICLLCNVFGHSSDKCQNQIDLEYDISGKVVETCVETLKQTKVNSMEKITKGTRINVQKRVRDSRPVQRLRTEVANKADTWIKVVKKKSPARFFISGKDKGKQVLTAVSPPAKVNGAVGTSNRFLSLPESEVENTTYDINHDLEEGEYRESSENDESIRGEVEFKDSNGNVMNSLGNMRKNKLNMEGSALQMPKANAVKESLHQASGIAQVEEILTKAFGAPTGNATELLKSANNIGTAGTTLNALKSDVANRDVNVEGGNMSVTKVSEGWVKTGMNATLKCKDTAVQLAENTDDSVQLNSTEMSAIEKARSTHIRTINADIAKINKALQSELACRLVASPEYHDTEKKMENFNAYCTSLVYEQLHTAQLDNVTAVLHGILASNKKKVRKTPVTVNPTNPYAHIDPPSAYKARPPDITPLQASSSSNEKAGSKTPVTRSLKKEMLRKLHENG